MSFTTSLLASVITITCLPLGIVAAEIPPNPGPAIIKMKMGNTSLDFQHLKHQKSNNNECFHCHKPQEWKIKKWDKEVAHQVCISCHDLNEKGPVECKECHTVQK